MTVLVEDVIRREELLPRKALDAPRSNDRKRVCEWTTFGANWKPDERSHVRRDNARKTLRRSKACFGNSAALDEISGRISEERHFREDRKFGAKLCRARDGLGVASLIAGDIADLRIDLAESDLQVLCPSRLVSDVWRWSYGSRRIATRNVHADERCERREHERCDRE